MLTACAWKSPPDSFALAESDVHVWRCALDGAPDHGEAFRQVLCPREQQRAQRLVRVLCPHCRVVDTSPAALILQEAQELLRGARLYRAAGCRECRQTGYIGRHGLFEMMGMNNEVRQKILKNCSSQEIREVARQTGLRTLREDGWRLVREGVTTPDEVMRVTKDQSLDGSR